MSLEALFVLLSVSTVFCLPPFILRGGGAAASPPGSWDLLVSNAGVSAMHMVVSHTNKVLIFDRTDYGPSAIRLPYNRCRNDSADIALKLDCWAHSIELDVATGAIRPLELLTDPWCSSASFRGDGTLIQTGGWNDGARAVRHYTSCGNCDWIEQEQSGWLQRPRWYATSQILPDNRIVVIGGRLQFSYEFVPSDGRLYSLPFLKATSDGRSENNLYPFVHLLPDGTLFVFANSDSILLDYTTNKVLRTYPSLPGGARSYPASGSSVMLPLLASQRFARVEVLICGGAAKTAYKDATNGSFATALSSCGRMVVTDWEPKWILEEMPLPRVMGDMINLPSGDVLIINGASRGTAGWRYGRDPVLAPILYSPYAKLDRFTALAATKIPRMYHSTAILLPDSRILVAGSNPNVGYEFSDVLFPTELRIEAFSPPYLDPSFDPARGEIVSLSKVVLGYSGRFSIHFVVSKLDEDVEVTLYAPGFATHAYSMNQRLLKLTSTSPVWDDSMGSYTVEVQTPPIRNVAPPGYYMIFLVNRRIPSSAKWIQLL